MRSLLRIAAACLMAAASSASAALLSVDDLLQLEDLGAVTIDPRGRWLVAEARAPYAEAGSFQGDYYGRWATSRLYRVDLAAPGPAAPLLDGAHGLLAGPASPDGARMVVYRLSPGRWQAGIFDLASDRVRWRPEASQPLSCRSVDTWLQHLQEMAAVGELPALRRRLARHPAG